MTTPSRDMGSEFGVTPSFSGTKVKIGKYFYVILNIYRGEASEKPYMEGGSGCLTFPKIFHTSFLLRCSLDLFWTAFGDYFCLHSLLEQQQTGSLIDKSSVSCCSVVVPELSLPGPCGLSGSPSGFESALVHNHLGFSLGSTLGFTLV